MKKLKLYIRNYFDFSQRESNGFLLLSLCILFLISAPFLLNYFYPNKLTNNDIDNQKLDSLLASIKIDSSNEKPPLFNIKPKFKTISNTYFLFNPNTISQDEFQKLGVSKFIAERILKYRKSGGVFKIKNDLKRIYRFDSVLFTKLEPYILLPEIKKNFSTIEKFETKNQVKIYTFDINSADTLELIKVYGIGTKLAERIIKFRNKLGGFITKSQLKHVFGIDSNTFIELNNKTFITPYFQPKKILINQINFDELKLHPYIGYKFAKVILAYRNTHGKFIDASDLSKIKILTNEEVEKIIPYIDFQ